MKISAISYLLLCLLFFSSCSKSPTTNKEISVSLAGIFSTTSDLQGGMLLKAVNKNTNVVKDFTLTTYPFTAVLEDATWDLFLVGFEGPSAWGGIRHCGKLSNLPLTATDLDIHIVIEPNNCLVTTDPYITMIQTKIAGPTVNLSSVIFGNVPQFAVGSTVNLTVTNTHSEVIEVSLGAGAPSNFTYIVPSPCDAIPVAGTCTITITLTGTSTTGSKNANIPIAIDDGFHVANVNHPMTATVVTPATLSITGGAGTYDFGNVLRGTNKTQTFTVTNNGNYAITISAIGNYSAPFSASGCVTGLAAGGTCTVTATFAPTAVGTPTGSFDLTWNDGVSGQTLTKNLQGTVSDLSFSSGAFAGTTPVGGMTYHTVTVTNGATYGTASSMSGGSLTPPFDYKGGSYPGTGGTCGTSLLATLTCTVILEVSPVATGTPTDNLNLLFNGLTSGNQGLTATAVAPALLTISDAGFDFGTQLFGTSGSKVFTVTNSGNYTASSLSISGISGVYSQTDNCTSLAPAATCTVTVTYIPVAAGVDNQTLTVNYNDGAASSSATRPITGTGANLTISGDFSGTIAVGATQDATLTVSNPATSGTASGLTGSGLSAPINFKGGSFPGTGGTCSTTITAGSSCTLILQFSPGAASTYSPTLTLTYNTSHTKTHNVNATSAAAASIAISDGATYDYGVNLVGSNSSKTFTLTNSGGVAATSITGSGLPSAFSFKGGSYPGTGGSCTSTLAGAAATCTIVVDYDPTDYGQESFNLIINYNDGNAGTTSQRAIIASAHFTASVAATYSVAPNWNDYYEVPTTTNPCNAGSSSFCVHGGDKKKFTSAIPTCSGITYMEDSLGVFEWNCTVVSSVAVFSSKGFKPGKGLRDLVNASSWKSLFFEARVSAVTAFKSASSVWWTNAVVNIDSLNGNEIGATLPIAVGSDIEGRNISDSATGSLATFKTLTSGTIFTISSPISFAGINISTPKVGLVTIGTGKISIATPGMNCSSSGTVGNANKVLICGGGSNMDFAWIEIDKDTGLNTPVSNEYAMYLGNPRFVRIHNTSVKQSSTGLRIEYSAASKPSEITSSRFLNSSYKGINIYAGSQISTPLILTDVTAQGNGDTGIYIFNSLDSFKVLRSRGVNNAQRGLHLHNTKGSVVSELLAANNLGDGVTVEGSLSEENFLSRVTASNNGNAGIGIQGTTSKNDIIFSTMVNNLNGLVLDDADNNTILNLVASNNSTKGIWVTNYANGNTLQRLNLSHNNTNMLIDNFATANIFDWFVTGSPVTTDCNIVEAGNFLDGGTTNLTPSNNNPCSGANIGGSMNTGSNLTTSFKGGVNDDTINADDPAIFNYDLAWSSISDWEKFQNPFRYWGRDTTPTNANPTLVAARGRCISGFNCAIWDWRLNSGDTKLQNRSGNSFSANAAFTSGAACPAETVSNGGMYDVDDLMTTPHEFLVSAVEQIMDGVGNDNGLCESNERCLYAPNLGSFQGEGPLLSCTYSGSSVVNVIMFGFTTSYGN